MNKREPREALTPEHAPAFILGVATVRLGEAKRFTMTLSHKREAFKPNRLYAHVNEWDAFILEKVTWGKHKDSPIIGPLDLNQFSLSQQGLNLDLARLNHDEKLVVTVLYTGIPIRGCNNGDLYSLPIIWAEPGASLLRSENVTQSYSVE